MTNDDQERAELLEQCSRLALELNRLADMADDDAVTWRHVVDTRRGYFGATIERGADACHAAYGVLDDGALEVVVHGHRGAGDTEWERDGVVIVFGTGGPHIQVSTLTNVVEAWGWFGAGRCAVALNSDTCGWLEQWCGVEL